MTRPGQVTDSVSAQKFLELAARYFENRPTNGEDCAYWANVYNAENCRAAAKLLLEKDMKEFFNGW